MSMRAVYKRAEKEKEKERKRNNLYPGPDILLSPYQAYVSQNKIYDEAWSYAVSNFCPMLFMLFGIEMSNRGIDQEKIFTVMHRVNDRIREIGEQLQNEPELTNDGVRERLHKELEEITGIDYRME